jgi:hypothetical protein
MNTGGCRLVDVATRGRGGARWCKPSARIFLLGFLSEIFFWQVSLFSFYVRVLRASGPLEGDRRVGVSVDDSSEYSVRHVVELFGEEIKCA